MYKRQVYGGLGFLNSLTNIERIVTLMQVLNIIVVRPGDLRVGQCNGVDAEVGALIRDAFDVRQRIQEAESAVDRAFAV